MNLTEEEADEIINTAWRKREELGFVYTEKLLENGGKEYHLKFKSQKDRNDFNQIVETVLLYSSDSDKRKLTELINFTEERATRIFEVAKKNGVNCEIYAVENGDLSYYKNYRLRFSSQQDLNKFNEVVWFLCSDPHITQWHKGIKT